MGRKSLQLDLNGGMVVGFNGFGERNEWLWWIIALFVLFALFIDD
ncbi:hypothetical protein [Ammoniphilus resinae]|uniref:Uncharacterized protein n=1 Tax=Ammoniphilus resinae TaxID=861532 RepID=A0ABS4GN54_9BACL|nr:hypothetical protein [Ammoniphilus resinae]MBP1931715.1 hypothetical protein [Ammoniphilus resinae]